MPEEAVSAFFEAADKAKRERAERMPDEQSAIRAMWDAYQRLRELGWNDPSYCPKDGSHFKVIEPGSTGIHDANYQGEWPKGSWWIYDGDVWPSRPVLFKLYPADQEKYDQEMREGAERVKAWMAAGCQTDEDLAAHLCGERKCRKCGVATRGEEAWVDGQIWCHPCADVLSHSSTVSPSDDDPTSSDYAREPF